MTITEFLLARIAEDEALARKVEERTEHAPPTAPGGVGNLGIVGYPYARVLTEARAKLAIINAHPPTGPDGYLNCENCLHEGDRDGYPDEWTQQEYPCKTLRHLAAVYADHPDYDPTWRA